MKSFVIVGPDYTFIAEHDREEHPGLLPRLIDQGFMIIYKGTVMNRKTYPAIGISKDEYMMLLLGQHNKRLAKKVIKHQEKIAFKQEWWCRACHDSLTFDKFIDQCEMLGTD
jgi:hypothetical protein